MEKKFDLGVFIKYNILFYFKKMSNAELNFYYYLETLIFVITTLSTVGFS